MGQPIDTYAPESPARERPQRPQPPAGGAKRQLSCAGVRVGGSDVSCWDWVRAVGAGAGLGSGITGGEGRGPCVCLLAPVGVGALPYRPNARVQRLPVCPE